MSDGNAIATAEDLRDAHEVTIIQIKLAKDLDIATKRVALEQAAKIILSGVDIFEPAIVSRILEKLTNIIIEEVVK